MSNDFTPVDLYRLSFPATMKVDYIRWVAWEAAQGKHQHRVSSRPEHQQDGNQCFSPPPCPHAHRLYQDPTAINVGCSPAAYPTQQYLACNKDLYIVLKEDRGRIPGKCTSGALASQPALSIGLLAVLLLCLA